MTALADTIDAFQTGQANPSLAALYGKENLAYQRARYVTLLEEFADRFPGDGAISLFSAPGRTEVGGNHTDHNAGRVLAAAVNLDAIAVVAPRQDGVIRVDSAGYGESVVDTDKLSVVEDEKGTVAALLRGVCAGLAGRG